MRKNNDIEMEVISKLYGYMNDGDKKAWSMKEAKKMYDDERRFCGQLGRPFYLTDVETLYDTIAHFIAQERGEKQHGHEHWISDR